MQNQTNQDTQVNTNGESQENSSEGAATAEASTQSEAQPTTQQIKEEMNQTTEKVEDVSKADATKENEKNIAENSVSNSMEAAKEATKSTSEMAQKGVDQAKEIGQAGMQQVGNAVGGILSPKGPDASQPPVRQDEKTYAAIGYIPFVALVSIIIKPDSAYVRMHAKQALLLAIIFFFIGLLAAIVSLFGIIGQLLAFLLGLVPLACLVIGIYSMYLAYMGFWWKIPVLSTVANIIPVEMMAKVSKDNITGQAGVAKEDYDERQAALNKEKADANAPKPTVDVNQPKVEEKTSVEQAPVQQQENTDKSA